MIGSNPQSLGIGAGLGTVWGAASLIAVSALTTLSLLEVGFLMVVIGAIFLGYDGYKRKSDAAIVADGVIIILGFSVIVIGQLGIGVSMTGIGILLLVMSAIIIGVTYQYV